MKRLTLILIALMLIASPTFAQDAASTAEPVVAPVTNVTIEDGGSATFEQPAPVADEPAGMPESVQVAIVIAFAGVLGVIIVAYAVSQGKTPQQVYWSLPTPVTQYGIPLAWEAAYRQARTTVSTADDEALLAIATTLGYIVTALPDGRMVLSRAEPPPTAP